MNQNQERYLVASLQHIDTVLGDALGHLGPGAGADDALFPTWVHRCDAQLRQRLVDCLARMRGSVRAFLAANRIRRTPHDVDDIKAFRAALLAADLGVRAIRPAGVREYGALDDTEAGRLDALCDALSACVRDMLEATDGHRA